VSAQEPPSDDYLVSEEGRRFRVRFDPASRIWAGVSGAFGNSPGGAITATLELDVGVGYRAVYTWGQGQDEIIWRLDNRWVAGRLWPLHTPVEGVPGLDMALYSVSMHRHDESPRIVLPMSPPVSVPFPFDIGIEIEMGRVFVPAYLPISMTNGANGEGVPMVRVGVLRASAFLDPWRSGRPGRSLEIGVGARYDVEPTGSPTLAEPRMLHRVAPGTAASLRFRFQTDDGLLTLDGRGDFIPHWTSESTWRFMALGSARIERTLLAINDQPISAYFDGSYRHTPESVHTQASDDVRLSAGVAFNISLK
jgi:hypothetical protein